MQVKKFSFYLKGFLTLVGYAVIFVVRLPFDILFSELFRKIATVHKFFRNLKIILARVHVKQLKLPHITVHVPKRLTKKIWKKVRLQVRLVFFVFGVVFTFLFVFVPYQAYAWFRQLPNPALLAEQANNSSTKILDRNGRLLYEIYVDRDYQPVALSQVPDYAVKATLAIEDSEFYYHPGIRLDSMVRAAKATLFEDNLQGASTITQQLVKNVLLTPERTLSRKLKEVILALLVESKYSKDQILEFYLNNISYGGTAWGIQSAAKKYFGKDVNQLDLAESALLAGLPSAPSVYSPVNGNGELAKFRQKQVLNRMVELEYVSQEEANVAGKEELNYAPQVQYIRAPHFVQYVRTELEKMYGKHTTAFGGLTVKTTLDLDLQEKVQEIVKTEVELDKKLNISNGAAIVLDTKNREILSYVGSLDYFQSSFGAYDVVIAQRQPGSSIKPLTYALALDKGYTPASIIEDTPVTYQAGTQVYRPVNYDGKFHGKVTLRQALANSYNIPAVKMANAVGPDEIVTFGKKLGLQGWEVDGTYGLSITLGGKEVRLMDLANAYATFGNTGEFKETTPFLSIKDIYGYEIYKPINAESIQVIKAQVAYLITHILSDNNARLPAFGTRNFLTVPGHTIAVKTGTTDSKRDNWTFGYTPSYTVGVWVGNNDNSPMNPYLASGLTGAAPIWNKIFTVLLKDKPAESFTIPEDIFVFVDKDCGNRTEVFIKGSNVPKHLCSLESPKDKEKKDKDKKKKD